MNKRAIGRPKSTGLSSRQREVVKLRLLGYSISECADMMGVEKTTAIRHIKIVYIRFGIHNVTELYDKMYEMGELA